MENIIKMLPTKNSAGLDNLTGENLKNASLHLHLSFSLYAFLAFLDASKAFGRICHGILFKSLHN